MRIPPDNEVFLVRSSYLFALFRDGRLSIQQAARLLSPKPTLSSPFHQGMMSMMETLIVCCFGEQKSFTRGFSVFYVTGNS
jgi:hypothetical protein